MPDYVDVVRLDVRARRAPTVSAPDTVTVYEGRSISFDVSVNVGYPVITDFAHVLESNQRETVSEGGNNPDISYTERTWSSWPANSGGAQPVTVQAPTLPGSNPVYTDWYVIFTVTSAFGSASATTRIRVYQSVAATISIPENLSGYENTPFNENGMMYNAGSPLATEIRHSFHSSLANARADTGLVTSGRPNILITPTPAILEQLADAVIRERQGNMVYLSNLPAVSQDTRWYGRLEIVQDGAVADFAVYTLTILNAVNPSVRITNIEGIEGTPVVAIMSYVSGAPYADRFSHVGFYNSQADAVANRNRLTTSDGIPSNVSFSPATPAERTGMLSGTLQMTLPYVTANKRLWGLVRIERDEGDGRTLYWQTTYSIYILNRVPAQIDVQEIITMDEESTMMIMFTYTRGVPAARGFGVSIHESQSDANNNRNPVMDSDDPRITLSAYDNTGSQTAQKTGTATIVTPDIGNTDRRWYPRFYMDQDTIPADP